MGIAPLNMLREYRIAGLRGPRECFAKWRFVIGIGIGRAWKSLRFVLLRYAGMICIPWSLGVGLSDIGSLELHEEVQ